MIKSIYKVCIIICLINSMALRADDLSNSLTQLETALSSLATAAALPDYQEYLNALESVYLNLFNFTIAQDKSSLVPLTANDTDFFETELNELNKNMLFFITNQAVLSTEQRKQVENFAIKIKDEMVTFLALITDFAYKSKDSNKAITILGYITEFYTQGVAQPAYRIFLGNMQESDEQIEQLKEAMRTIITPTSQPVPLTPTGSPAIELEPMPTSTLTDLTPAPETTQPTTEDPQFIQDIATVSPILSNAFTTGDTDLISQFMGNTGEYKTKGFDYYQEQIVSQISKLTDNQKQIVTNFGNLLETGIASSGMNTLSNKNTLMQEVKELNATISLD